LRTGYACVPLSAWFEDVVAIDPEPDMLRVAARVAHERGVTDVRFLRLSAEDNAWLGPGAGPRAAAGRLSGAPLHEDVLRETPFGEPRVVNVVKPHAWTTYTLLGLLCSSSLQLREVLGSRTSDFERDLRGRLTRLVPNDRFEEDIEFTIISTKKI